MKFISANVEHTSKMLFNTSNNGKKIYFSNSVPQLNEWNKVLNSFYSSNIIAAYDFRDGVGSTVNSKVGPNLIVGGTVNFNNEGAIFTRSPDSHLYTNETISISYPCTLVYIGKTDSTQGTPVYLSLQTIKWQQTSENICIFSRSNLDQGILPYNGLDNQYIGYRPNNTEWYMIAVSFHTDGVSRFTIRKSSGNLNNTVPSTVAPQGFNGYIGIGAGLGSASAYDFNGTMRLAVIINQSFTTESAMDNLFNTFINGGPASDLPLQ